MSRRLPNLNAVRAFDAAARHQSFSRAADELGVTHASISRYVKNLEAELGVLLFERRHRQVALTAAGSRYAQIVADGLMLISLDTGTKVARNAKGRVVVEADSDLALLWLMPLLDKNALDTLGIELELRSYAEPPRTIAPDADLALTWGPMDVPGFSRELFLDFTSFPVCAPDQAEQVIDRGLEAQTLIHDRALNGWDETLKRSGASLDAASGYLMFHRTYLCLDAAARGVGVAIGDDVTAGAMLRQGRLVRPCGPNLPGRKSFYLSSSSRRPSRPAVEAMRSWLLSRATEHAEWAKQEGLSPSA
ncbi:LysR family transcriptional regulator [Nitratireductor thuwali]|uniref:Glycine cleavage system transcriptional activator n=1 Tax=Nitratireductor thuwali TaxID=2267699 RepID=A0ABY5MIT5_9HYPH|nr:Glycine cleavage system transcriptional activator [Nitratireductor thuwali]